MENETLFAKKLIERLDEATHSLPRHVQTRLDLARELALSQVKTSVALGAGQSTLALHWGFFKRKMALGTAGLGLAMCAMCAVQYFNAQQTARIAAAIDEEILSDDAPVQAYMDPAFGAVFHSGLLLRSENK